MNFFFKNHPVKNGKDETSEDELVQFQYHEHNITEGSEFLDDAIRMHDQPLMYAEESVATASGESL